MDPASSHLDQIASLLATPPPRQVPPELRRAAMRQSASLVFLLVGAFLAICATVFVVVFFPWNITQQWKLDAPGAATTPGKIIAMERTGVLINNRAVIRTTFEYATPSTGGILRGTCYTTGSSWTDGASVTVRYRPDNPGVACVEGARLTETGGLAAFVIIFPVIGLVLIVIGVRLRSQTLRLLVDGQVVEAYVTALERTATKINHHPVFRIVLQRLDRREGPPLQTRKWDPAVVAFARARLESKQPVFVLFDPNRPKNVLLPEVM